ncbi:uncharacterized protein LOC116351968 [Contarinia nasturtii]|uniref:uncharacterized protein LOC116351968 n=1 Tax=Contarinia nasturtii TaxID=265458 RepID=UPI0012D389FD|nr:uncharacterized protein LOC116351968 [Contarinia nasturtii]
MYLQVRLREEDQVFQKLVWRDDPRKPLEDYCLTTVIFGLNSSPFLAVATVQNHVKNESEHFPEACNIIKNDSYMNDVSSGCGDLSKAKNLRKEITQVLADAGFPLRKWVTNSKELLRSIPFDQQEQQFKEFNTDKYVLALGLKWYFEQDSIGFKTKMDASKNKFTKRSILSQIASIFDPLGLLAPIIIYNKILMQQIWRENIGWDDEVSKQVVEKWNAFKDQIALIDQIKPQRWLRCSTDLEIELHGFADACDAAMGACIYMKVYDEDEVHVNLFTAKTKVAPIKKLTIPKLELCAAVLLVKLMQKVKKSLKMESVVTHYWSDSEITLAWIRGEPSRWKTFVANRVSIVQQVTEKSQWHYVNTKANPADLASRGLLPKQLIDNKLWWHGPSILLNKLYSNIHDKTFETNLEKKNNKTTIMHAKAEINVLDRFSTLNRAIRSIAFCKRYMKQLKLHNNTKQLLDPETAKLQSKHQVLDIDELNDAKFTLIKLCQAEFFKEEINDLFNANQFSNKSSLKPLYPFLDGNGILRVGGRLQNSAFDYNKKHPIIIPYGCKLMKLIIDDAHKKTLHGGNQLTLCQIRHEYWVIAAKRAIKTYINNCVVCHRFRSQNSFQLMGSLPPARTMMVDKAFTNTGTDLCGPIWLRMMAARDNEQAIKDFNEQVEQGLANMATKFHFNPSISPWMGGIWERGVGSIKYHLKRTIADRILTYEELSTVLTQIEAILNSRPITPMTENPEDLDVLTPGHFLIGSSLTAPIEPNLLQARENRLTRWDLCMRMKQEFWTKWSNDYISKLQTRSKWKNPQKNLMVGDMVLMMEENTPPLHWPLGRVSKIYPGNDNLMTETEEEFSRTSHWATSYTMMAALEFEKQQQAILEMLASEKRLVPQWLKPDVLTSQIQLISENLRQNLRLIGDNVNDQMLAIYKLSTVEVFSTSQVLAIMVQIPLIDTNQFNC